MTETDIIGPLQDNLKQQENSKVPGRPFPPGVSGNPSGRPKKGWTWRELLIEAAEEEEKNAEGVKEPKKKIMARKLVSLGVNGDVSAMKEFADRLEGKAPQAVGTIEPDGSFKEQNITVVFTNKADE